MTLKLPKLWKKWRNSQVIGTFRFHYFANLKISISISGERWRRNVTGRLLWRTPKASIFYSMMPFTSWPATKSMFHRGPFDTIPNYSPPPKLPIQNFTSWVFQKLCICRLISPGGQMCSTVNGSWLPYPTITLRLKCFTCASSLHGRIWWVESYAWKREKRLRISPSKVTQSSSRGTPLVFSICFQCLPPH